MGFWFFIFENLSRLKPATTPKRQFCKELVWSKSIRGSDGNMVKVERRYTNGNLSSISYTFYDKNEKQIGTVNYNANYRSVKGERK